MAQSVVSAEAELRSAYNKIMNYEDYLIRMISQYNQILRAIQNGPVQDELICARLSRLSEELKPMVMQLEEMIQEEGQNILRQDMAEIASANDFRFPDLDIAKISSILASFF